MTYFADDSRACTRCGCVVADPGRQAHIDFHERIDPMPVDDTEEPTDES